MAHAKGQGGQSMRGTAKDALDASGGKNILIWIYLDLLGFGRIWPAFRIGGGADLTHFGAVPSVMGLHAICCGMWFVERARLIRCVGLSFRLAVMEAMSARRRYLRLLDNARESSGRWHFRTRFRRRYVTRGISVL